MRLTIDEQEAIKRTSRRVFGETSVVRLFGSRADLTRSGGDIDLHIEVDDDGNAWRAKADFEYQLFALIEQQNIDVVIHRKDAPKRAIDVIAHQRGVIL